MMTTTVKAPLSLRGGLFNFRPHNDGLTREVGLFEFFKHLISKKFRHKTQTLITYFLTIKTHSGQLNVYFSGLYKNIPTGDEGLIEVRRV